MQIEVGKLNRFRVGATWPHALVDSWKLRRASRGDPRSRPQRRGSYTLEPDLSQDTVRVAFAGRVDRAMILSLRPVLTELSQRVREVKLDVSRARLRDVRDVAALAMLCGAIERDGGHAVLEGISDRLLREAMRARAQFLVSLG
jgi:hypothetical protein